MSTPMLESFLLELGKGFPFEARQKRFTFDNDHFFVGLVSAPTVRPMPAQATPWVPVSR